MIRDVFLKVGIILINSIKLYKEMIEAGVKRLKLMKGSLSRIYMLYQVPYQVVIVIPGKYRGWSIAAQDRKLKQER